MKKIFLTTLILLSLLNYHQLSAQQTDAYQVKAVSAMKKVMMGTDLSAHIKWDSIPKANLFALAPMNRLQGEVTIIDGKMHVSQVDKDCQVSISHDYKVKSPFAVYAHVSQWESFQTTLTTKNVNDMQNFIEEFAKDKGYSLDKPFPFRINGDFDQLRYHIISMPKGQKKHNHQLHQQAKEFFDLQNVKGELLGFYSQHHQGVFTHKDQFIHVHFVDEKASNAGHLDGLSTGDTTVEVLLPAP
jgi:acetolactate decarboxylase